MEYRSSPRISPPISAIGFQPVAQCRNAILPGLAIENRPVDDRSRRSTAVAVLEDCLNIDRAHMGEALIGPAQGVRRQDHVIERKYGIVRIGWLLFQDIETCSGDAALLKHIRKCFLID